MIDYKKDEKQFYKPSTDPHIITIPSMNFLAMEGKGDPNEEGGEYGKALEKLYGVAYALKMSYKGDYRIEGFEEYVVPPLEGLWWHEDNNQKEFSDKSGFHWISMIRIPPFIKEKDVEWAKGEVTRKNGTGVSEVYFKTFEEGEVVQVMHLGPYGTEPATVERMTSHMEEQGYCIDFTDERLHHEIYLSDHRKSSPEKMRTILRHPVRRK